MFIDKFGQTYLLATKVRSNVFVIKPKSLVFHIVFLLLYCFSGILMISDLLPYRPSYVALLVVPLVILYGIKTGPVFLGFVTLSILAGLSAIVNKVSWLDFFLFLRIPVLAYFIYYLVEGTLNHKNIASVLKMCITIGLIQLPIVALQLSLYDILPDRWKIYSGGQTIVQHDMGFGTFRVGDSALNIFLTLLVIFLLFSNKRSIIRSRSVVVLLLTATVLIGNSNMAKLTVVLAWILYLSFHLNRRSTVLLIFLSIVVLGTLQFSGRLEQTLGEVLGKVSNVIYDFSPDRVNLYFEGRYARGAALYYYISNDISWLGSGPSQTVDPITRQRVLGNYGHLFTFYSELGLLGWLSSVLIFLLIAFNFRRGRIRVTPFNLVLFFAVQIMSFTNNILNDISVFFVYCILAKTYLISSVDAEAHHIGLPLKERQLLDS